MAEWFRHSSYVRTLEDKVYADALLEKSYENESSRPYDTAYSNFNLFLEAKYAGHPAGTFLEEASADHELSEWGCWDSENFRFVENSNTNGTSTPSPVYAFSERGLIFMEQMNHHNMAHTDIQIGSNQTFRDMHYEEYKSIYTGTKPVPFSKLWLEVDDILGDVDTTTTTINNNNNNHENASTVMMEDCDSAPESQSCPHSEL
jgi:hypothetical protein